MQKIKKYKTPILILILITILICLFILFHNKSYKQNTDKISLPLSNKIIFIDPGHGGVDPGALYQNTKESNINLKISLELKLELEINGATVFLTRNGDYDLANKKASRRKQSDLMNRSKLIDESSCDLYLSIHLNAESSGKWHGPQVFYDDINEENKKIARIMQDTLNEELNGRRPIKKISTHIMYKNINKPGVLVEVGFLSNYEERNLLKKEQYQKRVANIIMKGVIKYFNEKEI